MKRLSLAGHTIGSIYVKELAWVDKWGRSWWKCICDCGYEYNTSSGTLRTARCCKRCASRKTIPAGTRFGRLTVTHHCYNASDHLVYKCVCDCGNRRFYEANILRQGKATQCGHCRVNRFFVVDGSAVGYTSKGERFLFDIELWDMVTVRNWRKTAKGYIVSGNGQNYCVLHRMVANAKKGCQVDHINRDKTDCRRTNLRIVTNAQNTANSGTYLSNRSTGHKNVYLHGNRYRVAIRKNGKLNSYGYYESLKEAVKIANAKRKELFGEYAFYDDFEMADECSVV